MRCEWDKSLPLMHSAPVRPWQCCTRARWCLTCVLLTNLHHLFFDEGDCVSRQQIDLLTASAYRPPQHLAHIPRYMTGSLHHQPGYCTPRSLLEKRFVRRSNSEAGRLGTSESYGCGIGSGRQPADSHAWSDGGLPRQIFPFCVCSMSALKPFSDAVVNPCGSRARGPNVSPDIRIFFDFCGTSTYSRRVTR